jgi:hypothetical protein
MAALLGLSRFIDRINEFLGRKVSWLILVAVLISAANAIIRKAFDVSSNAWLELQWYLYGTVFMIAGAYALLKNEHVRIDIVSGNLSKRTRDWIDLFGHTFFLLAVVRHQGNFRQCRRSDYLAGKTRRPRRVHSADGTGDFRDHQANRRTQRHAGRTIARTRHAAGGRGHS